MEHTCPICHKTFKLASQREKKQKQYFPFCCERCKLVDLGSWLDTDYKIVPTQQFEEEEFIFNTHTSDADIL